jgi:hypothetical protein
MKAPWEYGPDLVIVGAVLTFGLAFAFVVALVVWAVSR